MHISVVIPSNHPHADLLIVVQAVCAQSLKPLEIVVVDSSPERGVCPAAVVAACAERGIECIYESPDLVYPGRARNIGLSLARAPIIAFADVRTLPRSSWLEQSHHIIESRGAEGVWGATYFSAESSTEKLVRDGIFGVAPRRTLPGTVFRRSIVEHVGSFVDWVRAGEDSDWMLRAELMRLRFELYPGVSMDYLGLQDVGMIGLFSKWLRNYVSSKSLPHLFPQKLFVWLLVYPVIVLIAFHWNDLVANWRMDSPRYVPNVTKIAAILPLLLYIIGRGLVVPLRRGVPLLRLLPLRFIAVATMCAVLDLAKAAVYLWPINDDRHGLRD